ncbi:hypothetical protein NXS19_003408 [Fusarium pseudograminearum]|nr:hypothetical protein NXS19_003408 [Fusarium pseudograminearum]
MGSFVPILNRHGQSSSINDWYSTTIVFVKTSSYTVPNDTSRDLSYKPQLRGWLGRNPNVHKGVCKSNSDAVSGTDRSSAACVDIPPEQSQLPSFCFPSTFISPSHHEFNTRP